MAEQHPVELTDANFDEQVLQSDQPVLVDLWAPWCPPCRLLTPIIEDLTGAYVGTAKVGKLNVDDNPATAEKYGVSSIPTVLLFEGGQLVERLVGLQPKQRYEQSLRRLTKEAAQE